MTDITEFPIPTIKLSELPAAVTIAGVTDLVGLQGGVAKRIPPELLSASARNYLVGATLGSGATLVGNYAVTLPSEDSVTDYVDITDLSGLVGGDYVLVYLKALGLTSDTYQINFQCYDDLDDPVGGVQSDSFYTGRSVQNNENFTGYVRMVDEVETAAYMRITIFCNNEKIDTRIVGVHRA